MMPVKPCFKRFTDGRIYIKAPSEWNAPYQWLYIGDDWETVRRFQQIRNSDQYR